MRKCLTNQFDNKEMKDSNSRGIVNTSRQEPCCVSRNIFRRCKACFEAVGQQFNPLKTKRRLLHLKT
jgi:hypothetical protein